MSFLFVTTGCSSQSQPDTRTNERGKVAVATVGLSKQQNKSFGDYYAQAVKSSDAHQRGLNLNEQGRYNEAIEAFNQSLSYADSTVGKAMAYNGLAASYKGLGNTQKQIEFMKKEAKATLNEQHRSELLKQVEGLKAQTSQKQ